MYLVLYTILVRDILRHLWLCFLGKKIPSESSSIILVGSKDENLSHENKR